ncbi:MAG: hypothetical protein EOO40_08810, partial [Deltaproteobacteria bacterium]
MVKLLVVRPAGCLVYDGVAMDNAAMQAGTSSTAAQPTAVPSWRLAAGAAVPLTPNEAAAQLFETVARTT